MATRVQLDIDEDIRTASTLPAWFYRDPAMHARLVEHVFARSWQLLTSVDRIKAPTQMIPMPFLSGCVEEPLVLTRDAEDRLHCLSNVCTHRGAIVVEGEGHVKSLRCRYHGRRFALDGRMTFMPEFDGAIDFPSPADDLPRLQTARWGPLLFAAIEPVMPFDEWIGPVRERMDWLPLERMQPDPAAARDYPIGANWALYVDNYLEEFHVPYVHGTSLGGTLDYDGYRTERFAWGNVQIGVVKEGQSAFALPDDHPFAGERVGGLYFWLFPNLMLNFYPWGLSLNHVQPRAPDRTIVSFRSWVLDPSRRHEGAGADLHRVEMEDEEIVESVQRGVRSRLYQRGRYSPRREVGTHHFHEIVARVMKGEGKGQGQG